MPNTFVEVNENKLFYDFTDEQNAAVQKVIEDMSGFVDVHIVTSSDDEFIKAAISSSALNAYCDGADVGQTVVHTLDENGYIIIKREAVPMVIDCDGEAWRIKSNKLWAAGGNEEGFLTLAQIEDKYGPIEVVR